MHGAIGTLYTRHVVHYILHILPRRQCLCILNVSHHATTPSTLHTVHLAHCTLCTLHVVQCLHRTTQTMLNTLHTLHTANPVHCGLHCARSTLCIATLMKFPGNFQEQTVICLGLKMK